MWKFQNFSVTQILREINLGESRSSKLPFLEILWALNFVNFGKFCLQKEQNLDPLDSSNLISRKI